MLIYCKVFITFVISIDVIQEIKKEETQSNT